MLDLSSNLLESCPDLSATPAIVRLDISRNFIPSLAPLDGQLPALQRVDARGNSLASTHGLGRLPSLKSVDLGENLLSNTDALRDLIGARSLGELWIDGNPLCTLGRRSTGGRKDNAFERRGGGAGDVYNGT